MPVRDSLSNAPVLECVMLLCFIRPDTGHRRKTRIMAGDSTQNRDGQAGQTVKGCWAASLGDCEGKISREHLVSQALFPGGNITVSGLRWCKDGSKTVGLAALTGKILCQKHNSELSELDTTVKRAFEAFDESMQLFQLRSKLQGRRWTIKTFTIDGVLLERWFLKTLINLNHEGPWIIGEGSHPPGLPNDELVRIAFGKAMFREKAGLYTAAHDGEQVTLRQGLRLTPKTRGDNLLAGMFSLCGYRFFLSLVQDEFKEHQGSHLMYRDVHHWYAPRDDKGRPVRSHRLDITWQ